ncbi:hypothetical protein JOC69_000665 [Heliobacterium gestii]|nr:hypothetical protein [Heliomicrobium gestii]
MRATPKTSPFSSPSPLSKPIQPLISSDRDTPGISADLRRSRGKIQVAAP